MSGVSLPALAALRYKGFAAYTAGRFCAILSWQMIGVAVGWQVYQLTRDPLDLGFIGLAQFLPFFLLVLPAGNIADRHDRRRVLLGAYTVELLCVVMLLWFTLSQVNALWPVLAAMALFGAGRAFWMPTGSAMTPNLVPPEAFPGAIAVNSSLSEIAVIVGPAIGGLLYRFGPQVVYAVALVLEVLVVSFMFLVPAIATAQTHRGFSFRDVLEGLRFVLHKRVVLAVISLDLFAVLFGGATALLPVYASDVLHVGADGLGVLRMAPGVGAGLAALTLALAPIRRHVGHWMFGGVAVFGLSTIVFGLSRSFMLSAAALALLGAGDMVSVFIRQILIQLETPDAIRGRVSAVSSMFIGASNELGEFESGVAAHWLGPIRSVVLGAVATLVVVGSYLRIFPELRTMDGFPQHKRD